MKSTKSVIKLSGKKKDIINVELKRRLVRHDLVKLWRESKDTHQHSRLIRLDRIYLYLETDEKQYDTSDRSSSELKTPCMTKSKK
jgi:hypothetical protein